MLNFPTNHLVNFVSKYVKKLVPRFDIQNRTSFKEAIKQGKVEAFNKVTITPKDIAFLQYTGGTTGVSKAAVLTHGNMVANVEQASHWVLPIFNADYEKIVTALPLYHIFSLTANCLTFFKAGAVNLLITNPRDTGRFIREIRDEKFSAMTGVNTLFNTLLHHPEFKNVDFSELKYTLSGGMALHQDVANQWHQVTGTPILEAYGLTETCPAVTMNPSDTKAYNGTVGLPIGSTLVKICDDNGDTVDINTPGEIYIKGPQVMQGYWNRPDETQKVLKDDWLRTGDVGTMDEQGFFRLVDRKKDLIIVSGFNVYPNEVEKVITLHPGIIDVGVIGVTHQTKGEIIKACVVKKDSSLTKAEIINHCKKHLTAYKVPKLIEFYEDLPKSAVGKILRRKLQSTEAA